VTDVDPADLAVLERVTQVSQAELRSSSSHARLYRVVDAAGNAFAVKLVHPRAAARATALSEALAGSRGADPVLRHGEQDGVGFLVWPWHPRTLADALEGGPLDPAACVEVLEPIARALALLHRSGYVHGDLKPGNLLLTAEGAGLLGDLDEAVPLGTVLTRSTPGWTAPEVDRDEAVTDRTDRWGFALVLGTALAGPAAAAAAEEPARDWGRVLPGALAPAVSTAMDADPDRRTVSPRDLVTALRGAMLEPFVAEAPPPEVAVVEAVPRAATTPAQTPMVIGSPSPAATRPPTGAAAPSPGRPGRPGRPSRPPGRPGNAAEATALAVFGPVDPRARTLDRQPIRARPPEPPQEAEPRAPVWSRAPMLVAAAAALVSTVAAIVLTVHAA